MIPVVVLLGLGLLGLGALLGMLNFNFNVDVVIDWKAVGAGVAVLLVFIILARSGAAKRLSIR